MARDVSLIALSGSTRAESHNRALARLDSSVASSELGPRHLPPARNLSAQAASETRLGLGDGFVRRRHSAFNSGDRRCDLAHESLA